MPLVLWTPGRVLAILYEISVHWFPLVVAVSSHPGVAQNNTCYRSSACERIGPQFPLLNLEVLLANLEYDRLKR